MNTRDRFFHNSSHVFGNGRKFGDKNVSCISTVIQKQVRLPIVTAYIQEMLHYFHALKAQQFCYQTEYISTNNDSKLALNPNF